MPRLPGGPAADMRAGRWPGHRPARLSAAGPRRASRGQGRPVRDPAAPAVPVRRARTGSTGSCPRCHGARPSRACATRATATCPHTVVRSPAASTTFPSGRSRPPSRRLGPARPTSVRRYAPAPRPAAGSWTGDTSVAFNVLGAYGYPAPGQGRPRVWALAAYHQATALEWEAFLRQLDTSTAPVLVISDGVDEIRNAVRRVWPAAADQPLPVPFVFRCEHHLRENARENLDADCVAHWGSVRMTALNDAFRSPDGWAAFKDTVWPKHATTYKWVQDNDA